MWLKRVMVLMGVVTVVAGAALAADYRYLDQEAFKKRLQNGTETIVVDIQVPAEFEKRHFKGAVETNAFPVKSDEERRRLDKALAKIGKSRTEVVIVCPRGGGGAKKAYDYLKEKGVSESRLLILEKGMEGWPYPELCERGRPLPR